MKIHHVALSVKNIDKSLEFYKSIFGFNEEKRFERKDLGGKAIFLKMEDMRLEFWQFDKQLKNKDDFSNLNILGIKHIAFETKDIDKTYQELKSKNIEISKPKLGASKARYCFLKDPDRFPIEIYEVQ